jgi:hypothetical protein
MLKSKLDRDKYIHINYKNIIKEQLYNFKKIKSSEITTSNTKYDPLSIMHYGPKTFTSNGKITISVLDGSIAGMGQRKGLSKIDKIEVERFYGCRKKRKVKARNFGPPCIIRKMPSLMGQDRSFNDCDDKNTNPKKRKGNFGGRSYKTFFSVF